MSQLCLQLPGEEVPVALRASLCYPLVPLLSKCLIHQFTSFSCFPASQSPPFSLSFARERSLSPSLCWAWCEIAPCQAVQHRELKSRLCCAVAAVAEQTLSSPSALPPSAALPHLEAVQCRRPHVQEHPIEHRHRDVLQDSGVGDQQGSSLGVSACSVSSHVKACMCVHSLCLLYSQQPSPGLTEPLEVHMSLCPPPWSLWMASHPRDVSLHLSLVPSANVLRPAVCVFDEDIQ